MVKLVLNGLKTGKARFACAVFGIAVAVGSLVFTTSLVATNNAQAPAAAQAACVPWAAWKMDGLRIVFGRRERLPLPKTANHEPQTTSHEIADLELKALSLTVDYRPGGHVMQGPPMMALMAEAPKENPYGAVALTEGCWVDERSGEREVVCVKDSMQRFGKSAPALGETLKFVGRKGTMSAKIVGYMTGGKLPAEFPYVFANASAFAALSGEEIGTVSFYRQLPSIQTSKHPNVLLTPQSESVIARFKADEQKRMDYAKPLLLAAAFLTALSLLVNSLLLSVEARRVTFATLRILGMTRAGVVLLVAAEAILSALVGWGVGALGAVGSLALYVAADPSAFPSGMALDGSRIRLTLIVLPVVVVLAVLFALRPALKVRPMDAAARRPVPRRRGMAIAFACGFAAFVAVEVWGASLMRAFVPSAEWPDAIVSLLPAGVAKPDWGALRKVEGVKRISELRPKQLMMDEKSNALFLAAEWLPKFNFIEGDWAHADAALRAGNAVVITEMMSNAHKLHKGDVLTVRVGEKGERVRGGESGEKTVALPIEGVVDLNWHMVTSRGLVRGLNGASPMTDGPVFCSYATLESLALSPSHHSHPLTHLWVEYEPAFLAKHGVFPAGRLIEAGIAKALGNPVEATVRLHARDEIADGTLAHGSDLIGQAARVPFVFLAILAIGFVAMLVAEADARKREFVTLRAVGATKAQLAGRLVASAIKTSLVGIAFGLPVGSLVGWLFTFKTGNWPGLPHWFVLPVDVVAEGALGALVFALVFAVPTALGLVRTKRR